MSSKLASLHAGLIARKGEAAPAVAHPAFSYVDGPRPAPQSIRREADGIERRSFGAPAVPARDGSPWTDGRAEPTRVDVLEPSAPEPVRTAPPALEAVRAAPARKPATGGESRPFRLTLRLSADQRRRLRIAAAKEEMSLQEVLSDALDSHLDRLCACALRECTCLARAENLQDARS